MWNKARRLGNINADDAFTLVEILIAMAMAGFVIAAVYTIFVSTNRSYHTQDRVVDAQQRARVGIDFMVRDIRLAGLDPLAPAIDPVDGNGAGIKQATATKLRLTTDLGVNGVIDDGDGASPLNQERITYEFSINSLRRCLYEGTASESWQTLIKDVSALAFSYLDKDGNPTATLADIRTVVISMTVEGEDVRGQAFTRTLSTRVSCRNLGT
jgi:prepilin-type N-terminal cleavage/methylation domain-containing protein